MKLIYIWRSGVANLYSFCPLAHSHLFCPGNWSSPAKQTCSQCWGGQQWWVTTNFSESSKYCRLVDSSPSRPENSYPNMKTSLAALHSYLVPLYFHPPQSPLPLSPQTAILQGESVSCGSFPQAPVEKAISLGVWLEREKNRNQDCLGPETIQVFIASATKSTNS